MCSKSVLYNYLIGITLLLLTAIALALTGIATSAGFVTAPATPGLIMAAIVIVGIIVSVLGKMLYDLTNFNKCVNLNGGSNFCSGAYIRLVTAISALIGLLLAEIVVLAAIMPIAWVPGVAIPVLGKAVLSLSIIESVTIIGILALLGMYITCLEASPVGNRVLPLRVKTAPPSSPPLQGNISVATCTINKADCADTEMILAAKGKTFYSTSKTFAVLFKTINNQSVQKITAHVTDAYGHNVQIDIATDYFLPGNHSIVDNKYYALRFRWTYLSSKGIRADIAFSSRKWKVGVNMVLADGSADNLKIEVLVTN